MRLFLQSLLTNAPSLRFFSLVHFVYVCSTDMHNAYSSVFEAFLQGQVCILLKPLSAKQTRVFKVKHNMQSELKAQIMLSCTQEIFSDIRCNSLEQNPLKAEALPLNTLFPSLHNFSLFSSCNFLNLLPV